MLGHDGSKVVINGIIAPIKSSILIDGTGGGGQIKIDFSEDSTDDVKRLMNLRMAPLRITFEYNEGYRDPLDTMG